MLRAIPWLRDRNHLGSGVLSGSDSCPATMRFEEHKSRRQFLARTSLGTEGGRAEQGCWPEQSARSPLNCRQGAPPAFLARLRRWDLRCRLTPFAEAERLMQVELSGTECAVQQAVGNAEFQFAGTTGKPRACSCGWCGPGDRDGAPVCGTDRQNRPARRRMKKMKRFGARNHISLRGIGFSGHPLVNFGGPMVQYSDKFGFGSGILEVYQCADKAHGASIATMLARIWSSYRFLRSLTFMKKPSVKKSEKRGGRAPVSISRSPWLGDAGETLKFPSAVKATTSERSMASGAMLNMRAYER